MPTKRDVVWVQLPDQDDDEEQPERWDSYMVFRLTDDWAATGRDRLFLEAEILERDGSDLRDDPLPVLLSQYGGADLLAEMLWSDQELETGSTWYLEVNPDEGRSIEPADE